MSALNKIACWGGGGRWGESGGWGGIDGGMDWDCRRIGGVACVVLALGAGGGRGGRVFCRGGGCVGFPSFAL